jgi:hypothetical protein
MNQTHFVDLISGVYAKRKLHKDTLCAKNRLPTVITPRGAMCRAELFLRYDGGKQAV